MLHKAKLETDENKDSGRAKLEVHVTINAHIFNMDLLLVQNPVDRDCNSQCIQPTGNHSLPLNLFARKN